MQLQFLGATGTVTGSKYLLRHEGATLLVDCSLFQGYKQLRLRIHGEDVPIHPQVAALDSLSAHADAGEILQWMRGIDTPPKQTFITHGEPAAADAMRSRIERELHWSCRVPDYLETVELA